MNRTVPTPNGVADAEAVPSAAAMPPESLPAASAPVPNVPPQVKVAQLEQELELATNVMTTEAPLAVLIKSKKAELDSLNGTRRFFSQTAEPILSGEKDNDYYRLYGKKFERALNRKIKHVGNHYSKLKKKLKVDPIVEVLETQIDDLDLDVSDWEFGMFETGEFPYDEESSEEE